VSKLKLRVSISEHGLSIYKEAYFNILGASFGSLKGRVYFPRLISECKSYFSSEKDLSMLIL
jgi:hypothetical protein